MRRLRQAARYHSPGPPFAGTARREPGECDYPMTAHGMKASPRVPRLVASPSYGSTEEAIVLGAVQEDVRQTLRTGWIDPALEVAASYPVFFSAAWSAVRPNVGRSFLSLARGLRSHAADWVRATLEPRDLRKRLARSLSMEELRRVEECARAVHQVTAKNQVVVHALYRAVRRERMEGTGREEPPARRGVPEWQRWMSFRPAPESSWRILQEATSALDLPGPPASLSLLARWPPALSILWAELKPFVRAKGRAGEAIRLRRKVMAGMSTLPHPVDLQWMPLSERGFGEEERLALADVLARRDAAMAHQTLLAAHCWLSLGASEVGSES